MAKPLSLTAESQPHKSMDEHQHIIDGIVTCIKTAETTIPTDVAAAIRHAHAHETGIAKLQLNTILKAIDLGKTTQRPVCQDTGVQTFFIEAGQHSPYLGAINDLIHTAVTRAIHEVPLRPNAVNPLTRKNEDNPARTPLLYWTHTDDDVITIHALPKGSGSENMSRLRMLEPWEGTDGIKDEVLEAVYAAGGRPCPPIVVGVGIGGDAITAMRLGKEALLRPVGTRHPDPVIASLEKNLVALLNETGIGPMGLGGKTTVLDVHVKTLPCHPASLPVGIIIQCWAHRHATLTLVADGSWEVH